MLANKSRLVWVLNFFCHQKTFQLPVGLSETWLPIGGTYFRRTPATDLVQLAAREAVGGSGGGGAGRPLDGGWVAAPIRRVGRVPALKKRFVPFPGLVQSAA